MGWSSTVHSRPKLLEGVEIRSCGNTDVEFYNVRTDFPSFYCYSDRGLSYMFTVKQMQYKTG